MPQSKVVRDTHRSVMSWSRKLRISCCARASEASEERRAKRVRRAQHTASEWKQLHEGLPEQITAQVFDERMDLLRVIIEGPPDTPYQGAIFVFDIHLPAGYPDVPPCVTYWAWGRRINPNLYANGKVCLSLLGTWAGPSWEPQVSTLLQVIVSIQAMVLIEAPYCNEPGQQGDAGTQKSLDYNKQVQADVVYSMTKMASKPPIGCEAVVAAYIERDGHNIVRMARELPNDFITDKALAALDKALKHPLGQPMAGKVAVDEGLMEVPAWCKLKEAPNVEDGKAAGAVGSGINADEEKESCVFLVSCSLIMLLLMGGAVYFFLQFALWCVWQFYGTMDCMLEPPRAPSDWGHSSQPAQSWRQRARTMPRVAAHRASSLQVARARCTSQRRILLRFTPG